MSHADEAAATLPLLPADGGAPRASGAGLTAILCAHGMGQQMPFDTLQMVVDGLEGAPGKTWEVDEDRRMSVVRVGDEDLRRIELTLWPPVPEDGSVRTPRKVHVYEAYWAPITEGKVRLRDVLSFLVGAGFAGIGKGGGKQRRWLFGAWREFPPVRGATFALFMALAVLAALALMNLAALAVVAGELPRAAAVLPPETRERITEEVTRNLLAFLLTVGMLGAWVGAAAWAVRRARDGLSRTDRASWLGRLTDAGMSAFAWTLAAAMAFLVATAAILAAYAPCLQSPWCDPDAADRLVALGGVLAVAAAALLAPRQGRVLAAGLGLALLAAAVVYIWGHGRAAWLPLALAGAGLVVAAARATRETLRNRRPPAPGEPPRWPYRLFFGNALVAFLVLAAGLTLASGSTIPFGAHTAVALMAVAALATVAALASALVGRILAGDRASSGDAMLPALVALAASLVLLVLLVALAKLPPVPQALVAWGLVAVVAMVVRRVLVQYVGDVAAYVSPHKLDRFAEVRAAVKARVKAVADAVYAMRTAGGGRLMYDRVVLVGHSLGSVVTYDTLNALLADDALATPRAPKDGDKPSDHPRLVAERTRLLVTFGSPLDRTAFIFAAQRGEGEAGPAMASFVQPLIAWPSARKRLRWVNVHSRADIISSALTYYDVATVPASALSPATGPGDDAAPEIPRVENVEDHLAATPLMGHVEYWRNRDVWGFVVHEVFEP